METDELVEFYANLKLPEALTFEKRKELIEIAMSSRLPDDALEALLERTSKIKIVEDEVAVRQRHIDNDELAGIF